MEKKEIVIDRRIFFTIVIIAILVVGVILMLIFSSLYNMQLPSSQISSPDVPTMDPTYEYFMSQPAIVAMEKLYSIDYRTFDFESWKTEVCAGLHPLGQDYFSISYANSIPNAIEKDNIINQSTVRFIRVVSSGTVTSQGEHEAVWLLSQKNSAPWGVLKEQDEIYIYVLQSNEDTLWYLVYQLMPQQVDALLKSSAGNN